MQLVAYGAQDIYLTGNPQITFFKVVYRRHTNFSMEAIAQTFNGSVGYSNRVTATISRNGDLVHRLYLEATPTPDSAGHACANIGTALINNVELEIGGQKIDKHYGHWMETWAELTQPNDAGVQSALHASTGVVVGDATTTLFQRTAGMGGNQGLADDVTAVPKLYIPLQFWFCRNPGLALPLIALQYHEVKVILEFGAVNTIFQEAGSPTLSAELFADYIYLDTDERRRFAQVSHEYLIEQVQHQSFSGLSGSSSLELNFNHPVKELIWTGGVDAQTGASITATGGPSTPETVGTGTFQLKLNGHDRMAVRDFSYFTRVQVMDHHSGYGSLINDGSIAVYSFALKPEEHQPSGTCNFSRIDNAQLVASNASASYDVYAVNYNVLRIMSGMGGLAYSN